MVDSILQSLGVSTTGEPLCVLFVNTVGYRRGETPNEYLLTPADLNEWLKRRGLLHDDASQGDSFYARALQLRDSMYRIFSQIAAGKQPNQTDMDALNDELCEALGKLELSIDMQWRLTEDKSGDRALMVIALGAAELLSSPSRTRIRECADVHCGWIFIDQSKNKSRRWCSMSDCGNLAKARRFQERHRAK